MHLPDGVRLHGARHLDRGDEALQVVEQASGGGAAAGGARDGGGAAEQGDRAAPAHQQTHRDLHRRKDARLRRREGRMWVNLT